MNKLVYKILGWIDQKSYKYYASCTFLPLKNFKLLYTHNDSRYLLKLKDYEYLPKIHFSLEKVAKNIIDEWKLLCPELGANEIDEVLELFKQTKSLDLKRFVINYCILEIIQLLQLKEEMTGEKIDKMIEEFLIILRSKGCDIFYNENMIDSIEKIQKRLNFDEIIIAKNIERITKLTNKNKKENTNLEKTIDIIQVWRKIPINSNITVAEFAIIVNNFRESVRESEKQKDYHGQRR